jgi:hypothetical protein
LSSAISSVYLLALTACSGGKSSSNKGTSATSLPEQIKAVEDSGQLPKLDRSKDLRGPDAENNGIRDDIDAWIAAQPMPDAQKKAARQMARVQQAKILIDLSDKSALQMLGDQSMRAVSCLVDVSKPNNQQGYDLVDKIEALTANTKERVKQYLAYNRARPGSVTELPAGNTCES